MRQSDREEGGGVDTRKCFQGALLPDLKDTGRNETAFSKHRNWVTWKQRNFHSALEHQR